MEKNNSTPLQNVKTEPKFSDSVFRDIYLELTTKYKHETERQHLIRAVIEIYERKYPAEMRAFAKIMDKKREMLADDFASTEAANKGQEQRLLFKFPESLMHRLSALVEKPQFLARSNPATKAEEDEWAWFIKEFPQYVVPRKI